MASFLPYGDSLHEECGVVGLRSLDNDVARLAFFGLFALQHRGQESAGIASADGSEIHIVSNMGLIDIHRVNTDGYILLTGTCSRSV